MTLQGLTITTLLLTTVATISFFFSSILPAAILVFFVGVLIGLAVGSVRSNNDKNVSSASASNRKF